MDIYSHYSKVDEIYKNHLMSISNIKFTSREADVIACVVTNRSDKKIAYILSISPKTVQAHMYNLMNKLGCNSRDSIIDFIEKNGLLKVVREYYCHLMIRSEFYKLLESSKNFITNNEVYFDRDKSLLIDASHLKIILKHLEKINIKLISTKTNDSIDLSCISKENYYLDFVNLLKKLVNNNSSWNETLSKFLDIYNTTKNSSEVKVITSQKNNKKQNISSKYIIVIVIILLSIISIALLNFTSFETTEPQKLDSILIEIKKLKISPNNLDKKLAQINISNIKKIEKILHPESDEIITLFSDVTLSNEDISYFVNFANTLAAYYTFHENSGVKARKLLNNTKTILENYINSRKHQKINFAELSVDEIPSEFEYFDHFPELYTSTIYMLGRSYLYDKMYDKSIEYLKFSHKLGEKLNLFESYLSMRNGIYLIEMIKAEKLLSDGKITDTLTILRDLKVKYKNLLNDKSKYILNYTPNKSITQEYIYPSNEIINIVACTSKIIKCLIFIIKYSNSNKEIMNALDEIEYYISNNKNPNGLFSILYKTNSRHIADIYIIIGKLFLNLSLKNINSPKILKLVKDKFSITSNDYLEISEILFKMAKSKSKRTDFTKQDAIKALEEIKSTRNSSKPL